MASSVLAGALAALLLPGMAAADRGALTVEAGGGVGISSVPPPVGVAASVTGTAWAVTGGVRYALDNQLELALSGFWESPVDYFHSNASYTGGDCTTACTGTLVSTTTAWGVSAGARWVHGLVFRYFAGGEVGFAVRSFTGLALVDSLGNARPLKDVTQAVAMLSPLAGVEWEAWDRVAFSVSPRLQFFLGAGGFRFLVPLMVSWSWY